MENVQLCLGPPCMVATPLVGPAKSLTSTWYLWEHLLPSIHGLASCAGFYWAARHLHTSVAHHGTWLGPWMWELRCGNTSVLTDLACILGWSTLCTVGTSPSMHDCQHVPISGLVTPTKSRAQQPMFGHAWHMKTATTLVARGVPKIS
jgi:hypothetical protein